MHTEINEDGDTIEVYDTKGEYYQRGLELARTGGRKQYIYEGWLNGRLVRIMRR